MKKNAYNKDGWDPSIYSDFLALDFDGVQWLAVSSGKGKTLVAIC